MVKVQSFTEFFSAHSRIFTFFGAVPIYKVAENDEKPKIKIGTVAIIAVFLIVYWTGVVFTFFIDKHLNDKISMISNWIQMLGNSFALTVMLVCTATKALDFHHILEQFERIDQNLIAIGHNIDYNLHLRKSKLITFAHLASLAAIMTYDFYITIDMYEMTSVWYWVVSVTPLFFYSMGLYQAMFTIYWIKIRCSLMNQTLKTIRTNNVDQKIDLASLENSLANGRLLVISPHPDYPNRVKSPSELVLGKQIQKTSYLERQKSKDSLKLDMNILSQLFSIMNDLCKLSRKIDEYYGLQFLSAIGALFAITSIQVYYCYVTSINFDEKLKFTVWTLMVSVNLVIVNLSLIVGITTVCENVSNEATRILQNFSALQIKKDMVGGGYLFQ